MKFVQLFTFPYDFTLLPAMMTRISCPSRKENQNAYG